MRKLFPGDSDNALAGSISRSHYLKITLLGFAISGIWSGLHTVILPLRLLDIVSESQKNSYLGVMTFSGLVLAMLFQPVAGALSDRTRCRFGRRRPYILAGVMGIVLLVSGIVLFKTYAAIFTIYLLLQLFSNLAQGPYQAFIPETVPKGKRGTASGVKSLLELVGGLAFLYPVAWLMDSYTVNGENYRLWIALLTPAAVLLVCGILTVVLVKEPSSVDTLEALPKPRWQFGFNFHIPRGFLRFLFSRLLFFLAFTTVQTFALYFLQDVTAVSNPAQATASFTIAAGIAMLCGVSAGGLFSDRWNKRVIGAAAGIISSLGIVLIFVFQHNYALIMVAALLLGLAFGAFLSSNWALATELVPTGSEARTLAIANMATAGGSALARLVGVLIDYGNSLVSNLGYSMMLLICFISLTVGTYLLITMKERSLAEASDD